MHGAILCWVGLSAFLLAATQIPPQSGDALAEEPIPQLSADLMRARSRTHAAWLDNLDARGLRMSATLAPAAGRVLVTWTDGQVVQRQECSGVLTGPSRVITAAHCVCGRPDNTGWYAPDAAACRNQLARVEVDVFFSGIGVYRMTGAPRVATGYRSAEQGLSSEVAVADLAVIDLASVPPVMPATIAEPDPSARHLLVSYGLLTLSKTPANSTWLANVPYHPGIKQVSIQAPIRVNPDECGDGSSNDTICTRYDGLAVSKGPDRDAGVCGGDSGAPLFQVANDGSLQLVGVASYFYPPGAPCEAVASRHSYFVVASRYSEWINRGSGASAPLAPMICGEAIVVGPSRFSLEARAGSYLTASTFAQNHLERPSVSISVTPGGSCQGNAQFGYAACALAAESSPVVQVSGGLAQIAICQESQPGR